MDLLFHHTRLKCHAVVELKADNFNPASVDVRIKTPSVVCVRRKAW